MSDALFSFPSSYFRRRRCISATFSCDLLLSVTILISTCELVLCGAPGLEKGRDGRPADGNRWCGSTRQVLSRAAAVKVPPDCGPAGVKLRVENFRWTRSVISVCVRRREVGGAGAREEEWCRKKVPPSSSAYWVCGENSGPSRRDR